jgi:cell wall assembly regulator SMI1
MMVRMPSSVTDSWTRIEAWLERHAPGTFAALSSPAERPAIAAAEEVIGLPFPEALAESLLRHNGSNDRTLLPPFYSLVDTSSIADTWEGCMLIHGEGDEDDEEEGDPGTGSGPWWHPRWIPFARDASGNYLIIDQRHNRPPGRIGDRDHETGCVVRPHPMWASLPALLEATATALETGEPADGCRRVIVNETELDWEFT